jgi:hypothetical protein
MNRGYVGKNELPRWVTQQTTPVGAANSDQIRIVSPQDLQTAAQMYGGVSDKMFSIAEKAAHQLNFIEPDYKSMKSNEAYLQGVEAVEMLVSDPAAAKDGPSFRKAAEPILSEASKGMGANEAGVLKQLLNSHIVEKSLDITQRQANDAVAATRKFKHESWSNKQNSYLSQVDSEWTPDQMSAFKDQVKMDRRNTLYDLGEAQHAVLDKELDLDLEQASVVNQLFRKTSNGVPTYRIPGEIGKVVSSEKFQTMLADPEKFPRAMQVLKNVTNIYTTKEQFDNMMAEQEVQSNYSNFISKYDKIQDPVKKREVYSEEKKRAGSYSVAYQKQLKAFGASVYGGSNELGTASKRSTDDFYRKGATGDITPDKIPALVSSGAITRTQANAITAGAKLRDKAYDGIDKQFDSKIFAELKINVAAATGKNAALIGQIADKTESGKQKELKDYIKRNKAAAAGLPPEQYQKAMADLVISAKQKSLEIDQRKQSSSKGGSASDKLLEKYANK